MVFWKKKPKHAINPMGTTRKAADARAATVSEPAPTPAPKKPRWENAWARKDVEDEEVEELLHVCNQEMKSRALDMPFLLLPFRPNADPSAAKNFIRSYFNGVHDSEQYHGSGLQTELRLVEPGVLCSIMKWCWSRLRGGVVGRTTYDLFCTGEKESRFAKHAFDTFIPLSVESESRKNIIFDFFDLLAAIAANGKTNGLGGRKLSRLAGWWAFAHTDGGNGFDGGYKSWASAADATSHLFFAYLRSKTPDEAAGTSGISNLPRSLLALVAQTAYPPEFPTLLLASTPKVVMVVEHVSPTPYALLRRGRNFNFPQNEPCLQAYSDHEDPVKALTFECRRVLDCVASANQSRVEKDDFEDFAELKKSSDASWSQFQDLGFSNFMEDSQTNGSANRTEFGHGLRSAPASGRHDLGRPTTPSWADFLSEGFADDAKPRDPASLRVPSDQLLPPLHAQRVQSSQSHVRGSNLDDNLDEAELGHVSRIDLDETFWWVWMTSLAAEETMERKAVFGRCAFVETDIQDARWLVMEEQVKGAALPPEEGVYVAEKKSRFTFGRKNRTRTGSTTSRKQAPTKKDMYKTASTPALPRSKPQIEQEMRVQAAAAQVVRQQQEQHDANANAHRRGRTEPTSDSKTNSVMTLGLQPVLQKEAGPALQWARKFDKESIRARYLGDPMAGMGTPRAASPASTMDLISAAKAVPDPEREQYTERDLPPTPPPDASAVTLTAKNEPEPQADKPIMAQPQPIRPGNAEVLKDPDTSRQHRYNQSEKTMVSPEDFNYTTRKPVGSIDSTRHDHPALRQSAEEQSDSVQASPDQQQMTAPTQPPPPPPNTQAPTARSPNTQGPSAQPPPTQARTSHSAAPAAPSASTAQPAAAAAAAAMKKSNKSLGPSGGKIEPNVLHKSKTGSTRKFKNLFGRKKGEEQEPEALAMARAINGAQNRKSAGRTDATPLPSKNKIPAGSPPAYAAGEHTKAGGQTAAGAAEPDMTNIDGGEPGPEVETSHEPRGPSNEGQYDYERDGNHEYRQQGSYQPQQDTQHENMSSANFSDFSQGPLEDQPAFAGDVDEPEPTLHEHQEQRDDVTPTESKPSQFNTGAAQRLFGTAPSTHTEPETPNEDFVTPMVERDMDKDDMAPREIESRDGAPAPVVPFADSSDRWAQIRENAAKRRVDEQPDRSSRDERNSQGATTERTDDSETGPEETIEQRVARIRARVAQLTGAPEPAPTQ